MPVKHDKYGFLIGDNADNGLPFTTEAWAKIASDTRAIRAILEARAKGHNLKTPVMPDRVIPEIRDRLKHEREEAVRRQRERFNPESRQERTTGAEKAKSDKDNASASNDLAEAIRDNTKAMGRKYERPRGESGRFIPTATPERKKAELSNSEARQIAARLGITQDQLKARLERDANGRFSSSESKDRAGSSRVLDAIGNATNRITGAFGNNDNLDPTIAATKEALAPVQAIATPIMGAVGMFTSLKIRKGDGVPWYKRILRALRLQHIDENTWNKKQLDAIKEGSEEKGGGTWWLGLLAALGTMLAGLFSKFLNFSALGGLIAKALKSLLPAMLGRRVPGLDVDLDYDRKSRKNRKRGGFFGGIFRRDSPDIDTPSSNIPRGGRFGGVGKVAGKLLRRLPLIGGLFALSEMAMAESDDSLSRNQKSRIHGESAGAFGGAMGGGALGAAIGTAIFPGVGTLIGGALGAWLGSEAGEILGGELGEWLAGVDLASIPDKIMTAWNGWITSLMSTELGQYIKSQWDAVSSSMIQMWNNATLVFSNAWDGLTSWVDDLKKTDVGKFITDSWKSVIDGIASTWNTFVKFMADKFGIDLGKIGGKFADATSASVNAVVNAPSNAMDYLSGYQSVDSSQSGISKVISSDGKDRVYGTADGNIEKRTGGSRAWRNNNPGNLEYGDFAKSMGAVGTDGRFAIFPTYDAGAKAKSKLIFDTDNYRDLDLKSAISRYAPSHENDTGWYQKTVLDAVGGVNKRMSDYTAQERESILKAMEKVEGFKAGDIRVSNAGKNAAGAMGGNIGSTLSTASNLYGMGKYVYEKGKAWTDGVMPESLKSLRVKSSSGDTRTLDNLGVSSYSELNGKGGQAFQGGYNDPATLYATSLIQKGMGDNFDRVTAQNDLYHSRNAKGSKHTQGNKADFTVKNMSGSEADRKTAEIMAQYGLQKDIDFETINEYDKPSSKATGGHIDFKLKPEGQAKIAQLMSTEKMLNRPASALMSPTVSAGSGQYSYAVPATAHASLASVKPLPELPAMPIPPAVNVEAPKAPQSSSSASAQVRLPNVMEKAGRDIPDRLIAHIVTGGVAF